MVTIPGFFMGVVSELVLAWTFGNFARGWVSELPVTGGHSRCETYKPWTAQTAFTQTLALLNAA
ncbi:MAG: hypothetical protein ACRD3N_10720 [Terracidiphilus sp.]